MLVDVVQLSVGTVFAEGHAISTMVVHSAVHGIPEVTGRRRALEVCCCACALRRENNKRECSRTDVRSSRAVSVKVEVTSLRESALKIDV